MTKFSQVNFRKRQEILDQFEKKRSRKFEGLVYLKCTRFYTRCLSNKPETSPKLNNSIKGFFPGKFAKHFSIVFREIALITTSVGDHQFSKCRKFSPKLSFLTPWYAQVHARLKFKILLTYEMGDFLFTSNPPKYAK